jgi:CheY-like chemotaxis protein
MGHESCILVVEDSPDDALLMECVMRDAGIRSEVRVVGSADEAIAYLTGAGPYSDRKLFPVPQLAFIDLKLPGKSGHDLLEWMKTQEMLKGLVKVVLTGSDDPRDLKKAYDLGANSYLKKPLTGEQLSGPSRNILMLLRASHGSVAA